MALRVKKVEFGTFKGGKFRKNPRQPKMPKLGSGKRFERCVEEVTARGGAYDPQAVCAARGIRKYGKKRMLKLARKGKARHRHNPDYTMWDVGVAYPGYDPELVGTVKAKTKTEALRLAKKEWGGFVPGSYGRLKLVIYVKTATGGWKRNLSARARNRVKRRRTSRKAPNYRRKRNAPKQREYTLYPGGITFPTAADARSALEGAVASGSSSAYVLTPTGKRLKVSERRRKQLTRKKNHRSARARGKVKRPRTSRKAPNYRKKSRGRMMR